MSKTFRDFFGMVICWVLPSIALSGEIHRSALTGELEPLQLSSPPSDFSASDVPAIQEYLDYYGLDLPYAHWFGTVSADAETSILAAHVYKPDTARGTLFFFHGYFDHSGIDVNLYRFCCRQHFAVVAMDLPGHGLSSGERASIRDYSEYADAVHELHRVCADYCPAPYLIAGHSTGCAVALEYFHRYRDHPFQAALFFAPLVRSSYYHLSRFGFAVLQPIVGKTPRWHRHSSSDSAFVRFLRNDPLTCPHFPLRWARATYTWFQRVQTYDRVEIPVVCIQGTRDDVVDWKYNIPFLRSHCKELTVYEIEGARHHLLNEAETYRNEVFAIVRRTLREVK